MFKGPYCNRSRTLKHLKSIVNLYKEENVLSNLATYDHIHCHYKTRVQIRQEVPIDEKNAGIETKKQEGEKIAQPQGQGQVSATENIHYVGPFSLFETTTTYYIYLIYMFNKWLFVLGQRLVVGFSNKCSTINSNYPTNVPLVYDLLFSRLKNF